MIAERIHVQYRASEIMVSRERSRSRHLARAPSGTDKGGTADSSIHTRQNHRIAHRTGNVLAVTAGGGGPKLAVGVRVGLGLLAMGDLTRATVSSTSHSTPPATITSGMALYGRGGTMNVSGSVDVGSREAKERRSKECVGMVNAVARVRGGFTGVPVCRWIMNTNKGYSTNPSRVASGSFRRRPRAAASTTSSPSRVTPTPFSRTSAPTMSQQGTQQSEQLTELGQQHVEPSQAQQPLPEQYEQKQHETHQQGVPQVSATSARIAIPPTGSSGGSPKGATMIPMDERNGEPKSERQRVNNGAGVKNRDGGQPRQLGVIARANAIDATNGDAGRSPATATLKAKVKVRWFTPARCPYSLNLFCVMLRIIGRCLEGISKERTR